MVHRTYRTDFDPVYQLEYIHSHQHLQGRDQHIAHSDIAPFHHRAVQCSVSKCDVDEWIDCDDQNKSFCRSCDVVIDESSALDIGQSCVFAAVEASDEERLEDVLLDEDEDHEDNRKYETGKRREFAEVG